VYPNALLSRKEDLVGWSNIQMMYLLIFWIMKHPGILWEIQCREMGLFTEGQERYILPEEQIIRRSVTIWEMSALSRMERFM